MLFLADENFNGHVLNGLRRGRPDMDIVRVQDMELSGAGDPEVLERAADMGRVLLTHDAATVPDFAYERISAGKRMPGVLVLKWGLPVQEAIEAVLLIVDLAADHDIDSQVYYLPL